MEEELLNRVDTRGTKSKTAACSSTQPHISGASHDLNLQPLGSDWIGLDWNEVSVAGCVGWRGLMVGCIPTARDSRGVC